jgi:CTP:molybdopterin cytidylyltransferase MocA
MLQWGTPQDVEEYNTWSSYFRTIIKNRVKPAAEKNSITLIPLAGHGSRFAKAGYKNPKPLIPVSGKPMIIQAAESLPKSESHIFVTLQEHLDNYPLKEVLQTQYSNCKVVAINGVTEGQAITCSLGLEDVNEEASLLISATDNGVIMDHKKYQNLILGPNVDL